MTPFPSARRAPGTSFSAGIVPKAPAFTTRSSVKPTSTLTHGDPVE